MGFSANAAPSSPTATTSIMSSGISPGSAGGGGSPGSSRGGSPGSASPWGVIPETVMPETPPRVAPMPRRSPIQQRADAFFAKVQGGHMTDAQRKEAIDLAKLHSDYGAEEMRTAQTHSEFAKAADWFKSSLRLNANDERTATALEAATTAVEFLTPAPLAHSPMMNMRADHFGVSEGGAPPDGVSAPATPGSVGSYSALNRSLPASPGEPAFEQIEAVRLQLQRNQYLPDAEQTSGREAPWAGAMDALQEHTRSFVHTALSAETSRLDGFEMQMATLQQTVHGLTEQLQRTAAESTAQSEQADVKLAACEKLVASMQSRLEKTEQIASVAAAPHVKARYRVDDGGGAAFRLSPVMSNRSDMAAVAGMLIEVVDSTVNDETGETWVQHTNKLWLPVSFLEPEAQQPQPAASASAAPALTGTVVDHGMADQLAALQQDLLRHNSLRDALAEQIADVDTRLRSSSESCDNRLTAMAEQNGTVRDGLGKRVAAEAKQRIEADSKVQKALDELKADVESASEVIKQQVLTRIDTDGDGSIDQSEWTKWISEQAATVAGLEDRLRGSIAEVQKDLERLGGVEESVSAVDARLTSTADALEARLTELNDLCAAEHASAKESLESVSARLSSSAAELADLSGVVSTHDGKLDALSVRTNTDADAAVGSATSHLADVAKLSDELAAEADERGAGEAKADERADTLEKALNGLRADIESTREATRQSQQEVLARMDTDSDDSIDQSEWTKWISEQAATVAGLEDRLRTSIADVQKDLEKLGGVEESVIAVDSRVSELSDQVVANAGQMSTQSSALEESMKELSEQHVTSLAGTKDSMDTLHTQLIKLSDDHNGAIGGLRSHADAAAERSDEAASSAALRADALEKTLNGLRADIESAKEATRQSQQEVLARMDTDSDGSIDQSEWTKWISEQAATVAGLEDRLRTSIADVQKDLEKLGGVEESVIAVDARLTSSTDALELRLTKLSEQCVAGRTSAKESLESVDARLGSMSVTVAKDFESVFVQMEDFGTQLDTLKTFVQMSEASSSKMSSDLESLQTELTALAGVRDKLAAEEGERGAGEAKADERADSLKQALDGLRADIESTREATRQSQQEVLARMDTDSDGSIDQSEWTKWISEQAATVAGLEDRLRTSIADVQKDLEKLGGVEESVIAVDARLTSSTDALESRLTESAQELAALTAAAVEKLDARMTAAADEQTASVSTLSSELSSVSATVAEHGASLDTLASQVEELDGRAQSGTNVIQDLSSRVDGLKEQSESSSTKLTNDLESVLSELSAVSTLESKVDGGLASVREELSKHSLLHEESSSAMDARLHELSEQQSAATQAAAATVDARVDSLSQDQAAAAESMLAELGKLNQRLTSDVTTLQGLAETHAASHAKEIYEIRKSLLAGIESTREATRQNQQEVLARMDADGDASIDQSEWTKWISEQAATVAGLEDRLRGSIAEVQKDLEKLGGVEESVSAVDARLTSSISALEARLSEVSEQQAASTEAAVEKLDARMTAVVDEQSASTSSVSTELSSLSASVTQLDTRLETLSSHAEELDGRTQSGADSQSSLAKETEDLSDRLNELSEASSSKLTTEIESLSAQHRISTKAAVEEVEARLTSTASTLEARVVELSDQCAQDRTSAKTAVDKVDSRLSSVVATELSSLSVAIAGHGSKLDTLSTRADELGGRLTKETQELSSRVDGLKELSESNSTKLTNDLEAVRSELSAVSTLESKVDSGLASVREGLSKQSSLYEGTSGAVSALNGRLTESSAAVDVRLHELSEQQNAATQAVSASVLAELSKLDQRLTSEVTTLQELADSNAASHATEVETTRKSLLADIESTREATKQSQQEMLARMDADNDGSVDQSEWTKWVSEQAATVAGLEDRLRTSIAEVQKDLEKLGGVEESVGAVDARLTSSISALESRLIESNEQQLVSTHSAVEKLDARMTAAADEQTASVSTLSSELSSVLASVTGHGRNLETLLARADELDGVLQIGAKTTTELSGVVDGLKEQSESSSTKLTNDLESVRSELSAVSALESKVDSGLASVREELSKHSSLHEESSSAMDARLHELSEQQSAATQAAAATVDARVASSSSALEASLAALSAEVAQQRTSMKAAVDTVDSRLSSVVGTELSSLTATLSEHGGQLEALSSQVDTIDSQVDTIDSQAGEAAAKANTLTESFQTALESVRADVESAKESSLRSQQEERERFDANVEERLRASIAEVQDQVDLESVAVKENCDNMQTALADMQQKQAAELATLQTTASEQIESQRGSTQAAIDKIDARLSSVVSTELSSLSDTVAEHGGKLDAISSRADELDGRVQSGAQAAAELRVGVDGLTELLGSSSSKLTSEIESLSSQHSASVQAAADDLDTRLASTASSLEGTVDRSLATLRAELSKSASLQKAALSVANGRMSELDERMDSLTEAQTAAAEVQAAAAESAAAELANAQEQQQQQLSESVERLDKAVEAVGARPVVVEEISETMEDWLDGRLEAASSSQMSVIQQLEEQTAELDSAIGMLQRKIGVSEQLGQTMQEELAELTESAEARHTSLMTRIIKSTTGGVTKATFEEYTLKLSETTAQLEEVGKSVALLKDTVADNAQLKESTIKLEGLVESSKQEVTARASVIAEDLHSLSGEFAQLKVKILMIEAGGGMGGGGGMSGGGGGGQHEEFDEAAMLRESLRVSRDGQLPDALQTVVVHVSQTRERNLPGRIGAPRGTEVEYAIELYIEAPGEDQLVVRTWQSFRAFWELIRTIGGQVTPSPTLPQKEGQLSPPDLQVKLEMFVTLVLRNTPASHRHPLETFLGLADD